MNKVIRKLKKSNLVIRIIYYLVTICYLVSSILFIKSLLNLTGIETGIRIIAIIFFIIYFLLYVFINFLNLLRRKYKGLIISTIFSLLFILIFFIGSYYINYVYSNINNMQESDKITYNIYLITLKDTEFSSESKIGVISDKIDKDNNELSTKLYKKKNLKNEIVEYNDYIKMLDNLYNNVIDGAIVPGNYDTLFRNEVGFENIVYDTKVIYEYSEKRQNEDLNIVSDKDFSEPLTFLFLGVDSEGDGLNANAAFNGDTLMLMSFNPKTLSSVLLSIPRDTYVPIACNNNRYAKINSSAAYGTGCVISTINKFLDINIDYYVKINFKGVVDLVEAVGGVEVDVEAPTYMANAYGGKVCEQNSDRQWGDKLVCINPGLQVLNGEQALAYARCRHMYIGSDLDRVRHQQQVVEALANKVLHFNSIKEFQDILNAVSKNIATNMDTDTILSGYNVAKNVLGNKLSGKDSLNIQKASLETYSLNVYVPSQGRKTSAQGYYESSLEDIKKAFNIVLGKETAEPIKTFSFSVNETYEIYRPGKGKRTGQSGALLPSFVGKSISEAQSFCNSNNINLEIKYVDSGSEHYNDQVAVGLIGDQSVHKDVLLSTVSNLTVYVVNSKNTNSNQNTNTTKNTENKNDNSKSDAIIKGFID
ncbi:cell envelope-like function transcriptional attenuator common domain protein [Firmicutes bacterium CAG:460]|nr:cell envelope-like function transcriptional attenuator common domain protein [Firmicutes bacterium CAG:460]